MQSPPGGTPPPVLTRWSIVVRDWLGSDTLRALSLEAEALFIRLCLDQWEHGAACPDKARWMRAHSGRMADAEQSWASASALFKRTPEGLVHPRVARDRELALEQVAARQQMGSKAALARWKGRKRSKPSAQEKDSDADGMRDACGPHHSASASASASDSSDATHPAPAPAKAERKSAADSSCPGHAEVVSYFCAAYERLKGSRYAFSGGKDGAHVKALLGTSYAAGNVAEVKRRVDALFADSWANSDGRVPDLGLLVRFWNKYPPLNGRHTLSKPPVLTTDTPEGAAALAREIEIQKRHAEKSASERKVAS